MFVSRPKACEFNFSFSIREIIKDYLIFDIQNNRVSNPILLNIMFHTPMGKFHLEFIILPIFPPSSHPTVACFFTVGLSSLIHFQQIL